MLQGASAPPQPERVGSGHSQKGKPRRVLPKRIEYKVSLLTHQCMYGNAPLTRKSYSSLQLHHPTASSPLKTKLSTMCDRAFCSAAPRIWNALPDQFRAGNS
ncbi:hypothetical protein DPEC_G00146270 [Dallia pectoralis]|uniref:Uncharacterized protein n=1 Tax=Dallia pectoralis TaxID=75939 RepID=A0ACC2GP58_DALPE|nr:hypothetical protein DPEC_G00146270 [Dallia pectoralis]